MLPLLLGALIVLSVLLSGMRGAALLWHGGVTASALLAAAWQAPRPVLPCLAALCVAASILPLSWGLARLEDDPPRPGERTLCLAGGLACAVLAVVAVPRGLLDAAGRPALVAALAAILCGVLAAALRRSVVGQCAGLAAALDGLTLLAGLSGRGALLLGVAALQAALMLVAFVCLRRIAWARGTE
ncbi:hypothetical protein AAC691_20740 [Nguyenibacter vanlangensis]|uniref:NADH:quinone oxidoreductase n=1 Tax=Nguyenibacter vanlangensis TaxID=1216886 RepID=A0ABZ3D4P3_9PROT